jgi:hypothetical protein
MTSESTRFLGQPSETKPTLGRVEVVVSTGWAASVSGGVTAFKFTSFCGFRAGRGRIDAVWRGDWGTEQRFGYNLLTMVNLLSAGSYAT